jgi:hypothetical protein
MRCRAGRRERSARRLGAAMMLLVVSDPARRAPGQHSLATPACPRSSVVSSFAAVTSFSGKGCSCTSFRIELAMRSPRPVQLSALRPIVTRDRHGILVRNPRNCLILRTAPDARSSVERERGGGLRPVSSRSPVDGPRREPCVMRQVSRRLEACPSTPAENCTVLKINLSQAFAGQRIGVKQVEEKTWLVSFMR